MLPILSVRRIFIISSHYKQSHKTDQRSRSCSGSICCRTCPLRRGLPLSGRRFWNNNNLIKNSRTA